MRRFEKYEAPELELCDDSAGDIITNSVTLDQDETEWIED